MVTEISSSNFLEAFSHLAGSDFGVYLYQNKISGQYKVINKNNVSLAYEKLNTEKIRKIAAKFIGKDDLYPALKGNLSWYRKRVIKSIKSKLWYKILHLITQLFRIKFSAENMLQPVQKLIDRLNDSPRCSSGDGNIPKNDDRVNTPAIPSGKMPESEPFDTNGTSLNNLESNGSDPSWIAVNTLQSNILFSDSFKENALQKSNQAVVFGFRGCKYKDLMEAMNSQKPGKIEKTFYYNHWLSLNTIHKTLEGREFDRFLFSEGIERMKRVCKSCITTLVLENYKRRQEGLPIIPLIFVIDIDGNPHSPLSAEDLTSKDEKSNRLFTFAEIRRAYKLAHYPNPNIRKIAQDTLKFVKLTNNGKSKMAPELIPAPWESDQKMKRLMEVRRDTSKTLKTNVYDWRFQLDQKVFRVDSIESETRGIAEDFLVWSIHHLQNAYENDYNTPYSNTCTETVTHTFNDGTTYTVHRSNHGLTHAAKQSALVRNLTEMLRDHDQGPFGNWIREKFESDKFFMKKLLLAGIYMRAARVDDTGGEVTLLERSKKLFEKKAQDAGFSSDETKAFAHAHLIDPDPKKKEKKSKEQLSSEEEKDKKYIAALLNIGHMSDHRRMYFWSVKISFNQQIGFLKKMDISAEQAEIYIKALWDRSGEFQNAVGSPQAESREDRGDSVVNRKTSIFYRGDYKPQLFMELENNPEELAKIINKISLQPISLGL